MTSSLQYTFYLEPRDIGEYYIEPASVAVGEDILETAPLLIQVFPNPEGLVQPPAPRQPALPNFWNDDFFRDFFDQPDWFSTPPLDSLFMRPAPAEQPRKRKTTRI
jgi:hypothetical protein